MLIESVGDEATRYSVLPCLRPSAVEHEAKWVDASEFQELQLEHNVIDHLPDRMVHILSALARATVRAAGPEGGDGAEAGGMQSPRAQEGAQRPPQDATPLDVV
jgi:hypothetical protein